MIKTNVGLFWAIIVLIIASAQFFYKCVICDPEKEAGVLAFFAIAVIMFFAIVFYIFQWPWITFQ